MTVLQIASLVAFLCAAVLAGWWSRRNDDYPGLVLLGLRRAAGRRLDSVSLPVWRVVGD